MQKEARSGLQKSNDRKLESAATRSAKCVTQK